MEEGISAWEAFVLVINSIIGAGVLSIPWAYSKGGILSGLLSQVIVSFLSMILSYQTLQTMCRVSAIRSLISKGYKVSPVPISKLFVKTSPKDFIDHEESSPLIKDSDIVITEQKSDMTGMVLLLLGKNHAIANCILFTLGSLVLMVSYSSIFSSSLISIIPIFGLSTCDIYEDSDSFGNSCWRKYWFYLIIFLLVTSVLAMIRLKEQAWFQGLLAGMRFFVGLLIVATCLVALIQDKNLDDDNKNNGKLLLFDFSGAGITFSIVLMANYFQPFIPNAIQWLNDKETNSPLVLNIGIASVASLFMLIGTIVSLAVYDVQEMVTLEWQDYSGGHSEKSWWSYMILYIIILFPIFDITSIFPLVAINVSDNVMTLFDISESEERELGWKFVFFRIVVVVIPILCSSVFYNVGKINSITGLLVMINAGFYMPAMAIAAKKIIPQVGEYDKWFFSDSYSVLVIGVHILVFIFAFVLIVIYF